MKLEDFKKQMTKASTSSGGFIKLKDGEEVVGVFVGEGLIYYNNFEKRSKYKEWQEGCSTRFMWNFASIDGAEVTACLFDGSATTGGALAVAMDEYGQDSVLKIKRTGAGKDDTQYHITYHKALNDKMDEDLKEKINGANIIALEAFLDGEPETQVDTPPPADSDAPF